MTSRVWATGPAGHTPMTAAAMNGIEADLDLRPAAWQPTTNYAANQQVISPNNDVVSAIATHTSGSVFNPANWALSATYANKPAGITDGQVPVWQASTSQFIPGAAGAPNNLDGGNATSVYTGTFNFDGGSAT